MLHGWDGLVQELQYMVETDAEASTYVDSWLSQQSSDLALLSEIAKAVDSLAPWFDQTKALYLAERASVDHQIDRTRRITGNLPIGLPSACRLSDLGRNAKEFDYPADKPPTWERVEQMRSAEQRLDQFWQMLERDIIFEQGWSLVKILRTRFSRVRELCRTKTWMAPNPLPTLESSPPKVLEELSPNVNFPQNPCYNRSFDRPVVKEKVKTRGAPAASDPRLEQDCNVDAVPEEAVEKAKIPKKAFHVFCALLPSPTSVVEQRREISWEELLYAMDAIGLEPEKLYGSVWSFSPKPPNGRKVSVERSIQFHESKEVRRGQKIPRPMVRTFGRRLKHAFGRESAENMFESE